MKRLEEGLRIAARIMVLTAFGYGLCSILHPQPTLVKVGKTGYIYQHVPYPPCPDGNFRKVEIPEKDEVDALTVYCLEGSLTPPEASQENFLKVLPNSQPMTGLSPMTPAKDQKPEEQ